MADVKIEPSDLRFRFQLGRQLPSTIAITNSSRQRVAFKVKTTTPKKYVVKPSSGVVEANSTVNVQVIMQVQKEYPSDLSDCKDKFLVQTVAVGAGEEVTADTFKREDVKQSKLRVILDGPPAPPSPVPEASEADDDSRSEAMASALQSRTIKGAGGDEAHAAETRQLRDQLAKMQAERDDLRRKLATADKGKTAAAPSSSMSIVYIIIVALIAFLVGHFLKPLTAAPSY